jgi:hypothetical protein
MSTSDAAAIIRCICILIQVRYVAQVSLHSETSNELQMIWSKWPSSNLEYCFSFCLVRSGEEHKIFSPGEPVFSPPFDTGASRTSSRSASHSTAILSYPISYRKQVEETEWVAGFSSYRPGPLTPWLAGQILPATQVYHSTLRNTLEERRSQGYVAREEIWNQKTSFSPPLSEQKQKAKAIMKTYELFIYGDSLQY